MRLTRQQTAYLLAATGIILATAAILLAMGRVPICKCGYVKLWHGEVVSSENSQHLTDWYTPSHVIHGFIFYGLLWLAFGRRLSFGARLVLALLVECGWEIVENTDAVIQRYRDATIALDYYGDSVINSVMDILAMVLGFWLASRWPVWLTVTVAVALELFTGVMIRDNLTLNVVMLLWPMDWIKEWQAGVFKHGG
ncbi:DUF2585 domain-containing protein [Methyloligella solikamskensis]|uniref:UPF0314 protein ACFQ2F_10250 n=1 Tax=Methyloligella solikamskensis TaxID=1177756 RepID=A0ABW3JBK3_9HYPH